jgi:hypothetical protein
MKLLSEDLPVLSGDGQMRGGVWHLILTKAPKTMTKGFDRASIICGSERGRFAVAWFAVLTGWK